MSHFESQGEGTYLAGHASREVQVPKIWLVRDHVEHHGRGEFVVSVATALLSFENVDRVPCSLHPAGPISNYKVAIGSTLIV